MHSMRSMWVVLLAAGAMAAETNRLPDLLVSGGALVPEDGLTGRRVETVGSAEAGSVLNAAVGDVLEQFTSVEVSERGARGVQADLSMRGSTFEQVLLALDGLPLNDPQTGHHGMDLPFGPLSLERVTVIPGPGSALFGPYALAGTVLLESRVPERSGGALDVAAGSFGTVRGNLVADHAAGATAMSMDVQGSESDGFMDGADYRTQSAWFRDRWRGDGGRVDVSAGYADKDFGARDFYAAFPSRELTKTTLLGVRPELDVADETRLAVHARYRRHDDEFILDRGNPGRYRNRHKSETFTERIDLARGPREDRQVVGAEFSDGYLDSSNLGDRRQGTRSVFFQRQRVAPEGWTADFGVRGDSHDRWGQRVSPTAGMGAELDGGLRAGVSFGAAVRPPSFTELYYTDPKNRGNSELGPEEAVGGEAAIRMDRGDLRMGVGLFVRRTADSIDWVRSVADDPWQATNLSESVISGAEVIMEKRVAKASILVDYILAEMDSDAFHGESKYALNYARHDLRCELRVDLGRRTAIETGVRLRDVPTLDRYTLVSAGVRQRVMEGTDLYVRGQNLLDEDYEEIPGVPVAGASWECGVRRTW